MSDASAVWLLAVPAVFIAYVAFAHFVKLMALEYGNERPLA